MFRRDLNPGAGAFNPNRAASNSQQGSSTAQQVSAPHSPYLEARLLNLEAAHGDLRDEFDLLKDLYHNLYKSLGGVRQSDPNTGLDESHQKAMQVKRELEQLSRGNHDLVPSTDNDEADSCGTPKVIDGAPPHMRSASIISHGSGHKSLPPHLRSGKRLGNAESKGSLKLSIDTSKHEHEPLVTDGPIDTIVCQPTVPAPAQSPPPSPTKIIQRDSLVDGIKALSLKDWKPHYLTTLDALPADVRAKIPAPSKTITFALDFLHNTFGGISWSPGLRYINSENKPLLLRNRTYYMIDPMYEPYLPKAPGEHGAKLTAFFNKAPEEGFDNLPECTNSYTDVPMFVQVLPGRFMYFGNYSQTRWSDKLDNDTMRAHVPQEIKEHIAQELASVPREPWVTRELKKHFFPKPEYEGAILLPGGDDTTNRTVDEEKHNKKVASDVQVYIQDLTDWQRDADMKTAMIKADFILDAFDAADADYPPAVRLWWEYLECVDWKLDFYNMLVALQVRNPAYMSIQGHRSQKE